MDIVLFTDRSSVEKQFDAVRRSRVHAFSCHPLSELRKRVKTVDRGSFLYVDITGYEEDERSRLLAYLSRLKDFHYGIIDTEGKLKDVASLFHNGASDYVNRGLLIEGMSVKRISKASLLRSIESAEQRPSVSTIDGQKAIPSGRDWGTVRSGHEYTFGMMYIELDRQTTLKNKLSEGQLNSLMNSFQDYIERSVAPYWGKIWIWNDFGGLILFPYNGQKSEAPVVCLKLMLDRKIFSVEETKLDTILSYRIAFHIGNTVYKRKGDTGTIVSKSINAIFHLGQKYLHEGQFYITEEALNLSHEGIRDSFTPVGNYEGYDIYRMKLPL